MVARLADLHRARQRRHGPARGPRAARLRLPVAASGHPVRAAGTFVWPLRRARLRLRTSDRVPPVPRFRLRSWAAASGGTRSRWTGGLTTTTQRPWNRAGSWRRHLQRSASASRYGTVGRGAWPTSTAHARPPALSHLLPRAPCPPGLTHPLPRAQLSFYEIYNEQVHDLLADHSDSGAAAGAPHHSTRAGARPQWRSYGAAHAPARGAPLRVRTHPKARELGGKEGKGGKAPRGRPSLTRPPASSPAGPLC